MATAIGWIHFFLLGLLFLLTAFVIAFILFRLKFMPLPQKEMAPSFFIPLALWEFLLLPGKSSSVAFRCSSL